MSKVNKTNRRQRKPKYLLDRPLSTGDSQRVVALLQKKVNRAMTKWQERDFSEAAAPIFYGMYPVGDYIQMAPELKGMLEKGAVIVPLSRL
jgi:hypothetical protein